MTNRWTAPPVPPAVVALRAAGIGSPVAELLAQRGIDGAAAAHTFLAPAREQLSDLRGLASFVAAVDRLGTAAASGKPVLVVGDYDVDGVSATALMAATLGSLGADVNTHLPRRDREGYGLQPVHVRRAAQAGTKLLLAVDSGSNSFDAWEESRRLGVELVIVDHHLLEPGAVSESDGPILVNPRAEGWPTESVHLTAAGLAARLAAALFERAGRTIPWDGLLRLASLGTIADVAPLLGDNRVLAALGLAAMTGTPSPGLRALLREASVSSPVVASDVAFRLAPRINAAGRLGAPDDALELVLTRDARRARELAALLERRNGERQGIERRILAEARERLESRRDLPPIVVLASPDWHVGVVGVAAARLARDLHRPTILLGTSNGLATGSGRSVAGLALHELMAPFASRLERFGGHAQAIGMTVREERIEPLRESLENAAAAWLDRLAVRELRYDLELDLSAVVPALVPALAGLGPFGVGNPEPVFRIGPCTVTARPEAFGRGHLRFDLSTPERRGKRVRAVWWRGAEEAPERLARGFELLASVEDDRYEGVRLRVIDLRELDEPND